MVQAALVNVLEPIFEAEFAEQSYGFRPGRSCRDALRRVDGLIKAGYTHVVDADLKGYFDSIPHDRLLARLQEKVSDGRVLSLVSPFRQAQVLDGMSRWQPVSGAPQGAVLSPLLSNIYLDPLDHLLAQHGFEMVRYADDFVILCRTASDAQQTLRLVEGWTRQNGLTLHPTRTQVVDVNESGFDFLGDHFLGTRHWVSQKAVRTAKAKIRQLTPRKSGVSLTVTITRLNSMLRGWLNYFQHSRPWVFPRLDTFIRKRLCSIVRRRSKRKGCARNGMDNLRWPNAFFAEHGLLNLAAAHATACQSSRR